MTSHPDQGAGSHSSPFRIRPGTAVWLGVAAVLLMALTQGAWPTAAAAAACLLLALGPRAYAAVSGVVFPAGLSTGLLAFNAAALLMGEIKGYYVSVWWWDVALHLSSSVVLSIVGMAMALTATGGVPPGMAARMLAVLAIGFAVSVGAMWELVEFSLDATLGTVTQRSGLPDTMGDMAVNLIGAIMGAMAAYAHVTRGTRWPLVGLLGRFMDLNPALYPGRRPGRPARR